LNNPNPKKVDLLVGNTEPIAALRREIHAHPELGFEEFRTSDLVARKLTEWGIEVHRGLGGTGLVGVVKNGNSARAIGLRADMDALPIQELNTFDHASQHAGKCMRAATMATQPCCWALHVTWLQIGILTARFT